MAYFVRKENLMGEQFWNFNCRHCGHRLRLNVKENNLGNKVEVLCQSCGQQTSTIIGRTEEAKDPNLPLEVRQKVEEFAEKLAEKIQQDLELQDMIESIFRDGFGLMLAIGVYESRFNNETVFTPKVDSNGKIAEGTFTKADEENFRNAFKIKL